MPETTPSRAESCRQIPSTALNLGHEKIITNDYQAGFGKWHIASR
jgi:hypothetical protein